jgi:surface protein
MQTILAQMILQYQIPASGTEISLPLNGTVNVTVDWGDGITEKVTDAGVRSHTYTSTGTKTVAITGSLTRFGIDNTITASVNLIRVASWENLGLTSLSWAFAGAHLLTSVPSNLPPDVTDLSRMFYAATAFNQPIGSWNTAKVTDMSVMFGNATSFNQPIGSWDISMVVGMLYMFYGDTLCTVNYDNLLNGWAAQAVKSGVVFDAGYSRYSTEGSAAKAILNKSWTTSDGGMGVNNSKCEITGLLNSLQNRATQAVEIFPNPSTGPLTISAHEPLGTISIYNSVGSLVYQTNTNATQQNVELTSQEKGLYIVKVGNKTSKLVKE